MNIRNIYATRAKRQNQEINEVDFQKFQQKFGSTLSKIGKSISSPKVSQMGHKLATNKMSYNVGSKLDRAFNTQGYQHRKATVQKYNNSNRVVENLKRLVKMWNATMDVKYKAVNPMTIDEFNKDLEELISKYLNKL